MVESLYLSETSFPKMDRKYAQKLLQQCWDDGKEAPGPHTICVVQECVRVWTNEESTAAAIQMSSNCQTKTLRISACGNVMEPDLCSQNEAGTSTLEQLCINHQFCKQAAITKESRHLLVPPGRAKTPAWACTISLHLLHLVIAMLSSLS